MKLLGALLIDLGWIRPEHLDQALQAQENEGGRLGTCLLENGAVTEARLMTALSHQLRVPAATPADLRNIPSEVYGVVPGRLAIRWRAIPFRMLGEDLHVAMLDVGNLEFHDEAAFATGKRIHVYLANEARLYDALNRLFDYRHPHSQRFSRLANRLDQLDQLERERDEPLFEIGDPDEGTLSRGARLPAPPPSWRDRFEGLDTAEQLASTLVAHLGAGTRRIGLFKILRGKVQGWCGGGSGFDADRFSSFSCTLDEESVFQEIDGDNAGRIGPLRSNRVHNRLIECWDAGPPFDCIVRPVRVGPRLIAALLCDAGSDGLRPGDATRVGDAADALGEALGRLLLEQRLQRDVTLSGLIQTPVRPASDEAAGPPRQVQGSGRT